MPFGKIPAFCPDPIGTGPYGPCGMPYITSLPYLGKLILKYVIL